MMATGDVDCAARYLMAFMHGDASEIGEAGAYLLADALVSLRAIEATNGEAKWTTDNGVRPGI